MSGPKATMPASLEQAADHPNQQDPVQQRLQELLESIQGSDRAVQCALIRDTFLVNDVLAEYSLRHFESGLREDTRFRSDIEQFLSPSRRLQTPEYRAMLGRVFGIHGPAAAGVLANLDRARKKTPKSSS